MDRVAVSPLFDDSYLAQKYAHGKVHVFHVFKLLFNRFREVLKLPRRSLVVVEYELLPWFPVVLELVLIWKKCRILVDYDDALFHQYDTHSNWFVRWVLGDKIATVMRYANIVVVGNEYLFDYAKLAGAQRIEVIPTVIDLSRYPLRQAKVASNSFVIGWIGTPSTEKYLHLIAPALAQLCKDPNVKVRLIGARDVSFLDIPVEVVPWENDTEVEEIGRFDVGIMPLPDEPWTRGKCGFKLIQYMACGLPVVASPVGVNTQIVSNGVNGFLADNSEEWIDAIRRLIADKTLRRQLGQEGRKRVEERYCLQVTAQKWVSLIEALQNSHRSVCERS